MLCFDFRLFLRWLSSVMTGSSLTLAAFARPLSVLQTLRVHSLLLAVRIIQTQLAAIGQGLSGFYCPSVTFSLVCGLAEELFIIGSCYRVCVSVLAFSVGRGSAVSRLQVCRFVFCSVRCGCAVPIAVVQSVSEHGKHRKSESHGLHATYPPARFYL